jgi:hypothetical protein
VEPSPSGSGGDPPIEGGWLPPEPPGPAPDLDGDPPDWPRPAQGSAGQATAHGQPYPQPPQYGWPPPGYHPYQGSSPAPVWVPSATGPGNGQAIAAFVLGLSGFALLLMSAGFLFFVALPCAILAMIFGRQGKRRVDAGETAQHRGFAQAGWVIGIVTLILSLLAAAGWITLIAIAPDFLEDLEEDPEGIEPVDTLALLTARLGALTVA